MSVDYTRHLVEIATTGTYDDWLAKLRDQRAIQRIDVAIARLRRGLGDVKRLSTAVSEAKIDYGPGYRLYFTKRGDRLIILLCGGTKSSQQRDIRKAEEMAAEIA